jgi:hypothetical protein
MVTGLCADWLSDLPTLAAVYCHCLRFDCSPAKFLYPLRRDYSNPGIRSRRLYRSGVATHPKARARVIAKFPLEGLNDATG